MKYLNIVLEGALTTATQVDEEVSEQHIISYNTERVGTPKRKFELKIKLVF